MVKNRSTEATLSRAAYPVKELPALTSFSRATIYRAIRDGRLKARKNGKRVVVLSDDLDSFLKNLAVVR